MNMKQVAVLVAAMALFVTTLLFAPWKADGAIGSDNPYSSYHDAVWTDQANHHLNMPVLGAEWFGIAVVAAGLLFVLKDRERV